jgi:hypothetical protein
MGLEFQECDGCIDKTGTPGLCAGCLINREAIASFKRELESKRKYLSKMVGDTGESWDTALFKAGELIGTIRKIKTIAENTLKKLGKASGLQEIIKEADSILDGINNVQGHDPKGSN